jgi:hypothetical protein
MHKKKEAIMANKVSTVVKIAQAILDRIGTAKRRASLLTQELVHLHKITGDQTYKEMAEISNKLDLTLESKYQAEFKKQIK